MMHSRENGDWYHWPCPAVILNYQQFESYTVTWTWTFRVPFSAMARFEFEAPDIPTATGIILDLDNCMSRQSNLYLGR